jgi:hypothetical protein
VDGLLDGPSGLVQTALFGQHRGPVHRVAETVVGQVPQLFLDGPEPLDDGFLRQGQPAFTRQPIRSTKPLPPSAQGSSLLSPLSPFLALLSLPSLEPLSLLSLEPLSLEPLSFEPLSLPLLSLAFLSELGGQEESRWSAFFGLPSDLQEEDFLGGSLWWGSLELSALSAPLSALSDPLSAPSE